MATLWIDSKNCMVLWYIGTQREIIDTHLLFIKTSFYFCLSSTITGNHILEKLTPLLQCASSERHTPTDIYTRARKCSFCNSFGDVFICFISPWKIPLSLFKRKEWQQPSDHQDIISSCPHYGFCFRYVCYDLNDNSTLRNVDNHRMDLTKAMPKASRNVSCPPFSLILLSGRRCTPYRGDNLI